MCRCVKSFFVIFLTYRRLKKKHWVIECDHLVHEGFESTVSLFCTAKHIVFSDLK